MKIFYLNYAKEKGNISKVNNEIIITLAKRYKGTPEESLLIRELLEAFHEKE